MEKIMSHQLKEYCVWKMQRKKNGEEVDDVLICSIESTKYPFEKIRETLQSKRLKGDFIICFETVQKMGRYINNLIGFKKIKFDGFSIVNKNKTKLYNKVMNEYVKKYEECKKEKYS